LGKHIPGNPTVIVVNMPGAGGVKMTNWAYTVAPKDGTTIGMPLMTVAVNQHLRPKKIRYDATKLNWIGNMERSTSLLFTWHTSKTKTIQDVQDRPRL
jgi:tripartite-type tricarboxylate transporter receptor subunit TctC